MISKLYDSLKVFVYSAANSVGLKAQIYISAVTMIDVVLVEDIIETFIEVFKVEENNSSPCLHADLNLVNVSANLHSCINTG